jgi:S-layer protein (TIGR01567 family)
MRLLKNILAGITALIIITIIAMAAPSITVTYPDGGTVSGTITLSANASDTEGNITNVSFDYSPDGGATWHPIGNNATGNITYTWDWDTTLVSDGDYLIRATATNDTGATANDTSTVFTVQNVVAPSITSYQPADNNPSTPNGSTQNFSVRFDQDVNVTWEINGTQVQDNGMVSAGAWVNYTNSTAGVGVYLVSAIGTNANGTAYHNWTWTVTDSTPPASVTNLSVAGRGMTWINWSWENPSDSDFDHTEVWLDSAFETNTSYSYYNATNLAPDTNHTITLYTVDITGNKNETSPMSKSNTTLPNTPTGDVSLQFGDVFVTFTNVTTPGNTTVETTTDPDPGSHSFVAASSYYYNITTTASFSSVNISIPYNYSGDESLVRLYKWSGSWSDVTGTVDAGADRVYGDTTSLSVFVAGVPPAPGITINEPTDSTPENLEGETRTFNITVNQTVNIKWEINGLVNNSLNDLTTVNLSMGEGVYNVTVTAWNANGSANVTWNWTVHPKYYYTGNRIWDAGRDMALDYTWTPQSFSGFFYDLDEDVSSENLTIHLNSKSDRTIGEGDLVYTSTPVSVGYKYDAWGTYKAIGFLARKYFAAYVDNGVVSDKDLLSSGYLCEILIDEGESNEKHTVSIGSTLPLKEGYALKAIDISVEDAFVRFVLLKDGEEVSGSDDIVGNGETYVYERKIGSVKDVPIIMVHVDKVFHGRETDAAFIRGVFQISENPVQIKTGDIYGVMKVKSRSGGITMENDNVLDLSRDSIVDIMGDIKFKVADSDTLRFAPFVPGLEELRGTVSRGDASFTWTPLNFEGLYYDFDTGFSSESLSVTVDVSSRSIDEDNLVYTSVPVNTAFEYDPWGSYDLIGFMAEKYFAAYNNTNVDGADDDLLSGGYLSKVLIDEGSYNEKHTVSIGSTLPLKEGYALKAIDISVEDAFVRFVLLKDGEEVPNSDAIKGNGETYVYEKKIGSVKNVPIIMVHVDKVFHGRETDAAFIRGVFQISENPVQIKTGDDYGIMEVKSRIGGITMRNTQSISLDPDSTVDVMGEIRFKVADNSTDLRYYPFITVDLAEESASQLVIDAPETATERDVITITVTDGLGSPVEGANVEFDGENIGATDSTGEITHTLAKAGVFTINATKVGYESTSKTITVEKYVETQLKIESSSEILQTDTLELTVTVGGEPLSGVSVKVDNMSVGTTDESGRFKYTFNTSGTHTIRVEKSGYIAAEKTINVIKPYVEFKATTFNVTPVNVTVKTPVYITANITNTGNIEGEQLVELKINGSAVDSQNITLKPGEMVTVNFSYIETVPGSYFAEILNKGGEFHVVKKPVSWMAYAGVATVIGLILIYLATMRPETLTPIGNKASVLKDRIALKFSQLKMKIKK